MGPNPRFWPLFGLYPLIGGEREKAKNIFMSSTERSGDGEQSYV